MALRTPEERTRLRRTSHLVQGVVNLTLGALLAYVAATTPTVWWESLLLYGAGISVGIWGIGHLLELDALVWTGSFALMTLALGFAAWAVAHEAGWGGWSWIIVAAFLWILEVTVSLWARRLVRREAVR